MGKITKTIGVAGAAAGVAAGAAYLSKQENRAKLKEQITKIVGEENYSYVKKLGRPGAVGKPEDAHMVDEGAMTSVQYYNELQQEAAEAEKEEGK